MAIVDPNSGTGDSPSGLTLSGSTPPAGGKVPLSKNKKLAIGAGAAVILGIGVYLFSKHKSSSSSTSGTAATPTTTLVTPTDSGGGSGYSSGGYGSWNDSNSDSGVQIQGAGVSGYGPFANLDTSTGPLAGYPIGTQFTVDGFSGVTTTPGNYAITVPGKGISVDGSGEPNGTGYFVNPNGTVIDSSSNSIAAANEAKAGAITGATVTQ